VFAIFFFSQTLAQICMLTVPTGALSAAGLATPYLQTGCAQADPAQASFVQGVILDTGNPGNPMFVYNPLVIDMGTAAAVKPVLPVLPQQSVVGLWFGTNGNTLTLVDNAGSLQGANCVNGIIVNGVVDIFGQFAHCNAIAFFTQALALLRGMTVPPLGVAIDGKPCPTIRDFFVVDQDQSDNVNTVYIVTPAGTIAQNNTANFLQFPTPKAILSNGSDNKLLVAIDTAIGCKPWRVPDLADQTNGGFAQNQAPASALNELHAAMWQQAPIALVPLNDAMAKVMNQPSLLKVNAWRLATGQPTAATGKDADQVDYCFNLYLTFPLRLLKLMGSLINFPSPDPAAADSLYTFLGQRFVAAFGDQNMGCFDKLQIPRALPPIRLNLNGNGQAVGVIVTPPNNGAVNPIYAATTGGAKDVKKAAAAPSSLWTTLLLIPVLVFLLL